MLETSAHAWERTAIETFLKAYQEGMEGCITNVAEQELAQSLLRLFLLERIVDDLRAAIVSRPLLLESVVVTFFNLIAAENMFAGGETHV